MKSRESCAKSIHHASGLLPFSLIDPSIALPLFHHKSPKNKFVKDRNLRQVEREEEKLHRQKNSLQRSEEKNRQKTELSRRDGK